MKTFKDKEGVEWSLALDFSIAMKIESFDFGPAFSSPSKNEAGELEYESHYISFLDADDDSFETYLTNSKICFTMIWCCCEKQAYERDVKDMEKFAERFDGAAFDAARMAFFEELPNFFPQKAIMLRALTRKFSEVMIAQDKAMGQVIEETITQENIDKITKKLRQKAEEATRKILEE